MTSDASSPAVPRPLDGRRFDGIILQGGSARGDDNTAWIGENRVLAGER